MENRFKFRAWSFEENKMYYNIQNTYEDILNNDFYCFGSFLDDNEIKVMQSTGLADVNGKLIFEGDILDNKDCSDSIVKVVFLFPSNENGNRYGFFLENLNTHSIKEFFNPDIDLNKLEIIGNIYE